MSVSFRKQIKRVKGPILDCRPKKFSSGQQLPRGRGKEDETRGEEKFLRDDSQDQAGRVRSGRVGPFIPTLQALALVSRNHTRPIPRAHHFALKVGRRRTSVHEGFQHRSPGSESHLLSAFGDLGVHVAAGRRSCTTTGSS